MFFCCLLAIELADQPQTGKADEAQTSDGTPSETPAETPAPSPTPVDATPTSGSGTAVPDFKTFLAERRTSRLSNKISQEQLNRQVSAFKFQKGIL